MLFINLFIYIYIYIYIYKFLVNDQFKDYYNFLLIIVTILIINNFLFCKLISKLVIIVINNFYQI